MEEKYMKNNVKQARLQAELTQQELADRVGITRQTVSLIEKGKYNPSLKLCLQICYAVQSKLDELFWVEEEELR
ncbi:transcriptional regulator [Bacillus sp. NRRL B-14911]|nr:transcriptional regulator [Bacillus sp. NRRL B-14911]